MSQDPRPRRNPHSPREKARTESPARKKLILRQIGRARTRLLVCFLTLPVYMVAVWLLLNNRQDIDGLMFVYMAVWSVFGIDMARRRCPDCGEQFFVKSIFLNLITHRCVHCGLSLDWEDEDGGDATHQRVKF